MRRATENPTKLASLKSKVGLILIGVISGYVLISYVILHSVVFSSFTNLDQSIAKRNLTRVESALTNEFDTLTVVLKDWGSWDDSQTFVTGRNDAYESSNLDGDSLTNLHIDIALYFDNARQLVWGGVFDANANTVDEVDSAFAEKISRMDKLFEIESINAVVLGMIGGEKFPMIIGSHHITDSHYQKPSGTIVFARHMDAARIAALNLRTEVDFKLSLPPPTSSGQILEKSDTERTELNQLRETPQGLIQTKTIVSPTGETAAVLEVRTPPDVTALGSETVRIAMLLSFLAGLLVIGILWFLLHRFITTPITTLSDHMGHIREDGNLATRIAFKREDEIGTLGNQFDSLIGELEKTREKMTAARDTALESSRLKSEFLATMSHEIRTPMNGVMGMTELLLHTRLSDKQVGLAQTIQHSAEALLDIINDILNFSKIESGRFELEIADMDMYEILEDIGDLFADRAQRKKIELLYAVTPPDLHTAFVGDAGRIRQILINLVGNALKFTEYGQILIHVKSVKEDQQKVDLRIEVTDTGIGIPSKEKDRVFESFVQADGSTTRQYGGTGLGLAICKSLVELMGGQIGIDSQPGQGSTFWITLTLEKRHLCRDAAPTAPQSLRGLNVLLVDDNATHIGILQRQLGAWGMQTTSVKDGVLALDTLDQSNLQQPAFDLVILNARVTASDSMKLVKSIRSNQRIHNLPVIMLTSIHQEAMNAERLAAKNTWYLTRPVKRSELLCAVSLALCPDQGIALSSTANQSDRAIKITNARLSGVRILLAEDNPVNAKVTIDMLTLLDCSVEWVENGALAVSRQNSEEYDLILMDCQMPVMDGFEASCTIRLQERGRKRRIPIVAVTANAMTGDRERCREAGMDDYMTKPFDVNDLHNIIKRWTSRDLNVQRTTESINKSDSRSE